VVSHLWREGVVRLYIEQDCVDHLPHLLVNWEVFLSLEVDMAQNDYYTDIASFLPAQSQRVLSYSFLVLGRCYYHRFRIDAHYLRYY
jgi:hypothetical protein